MNAQHNKLLRGRTRAAWVAAVVGLLAVLLAVVWWLNVRGEYGVHAQGQSGAAPAGDTSLIERGAYLARVGNCMGCHSVPGAASYAGGRAIETPFGEVYSSNLTPDAQTGLGNWSAQDFWRALHNGRSKSGRLLYPAFPYDSYTAVRREDSDALFAYLQSLPAVEQPAKDHALRFPYNSQASLALWRAMYFSPGVWKDEPSQTPQWNRGAYLVQGLGHCAACHSPRSSLGATQAGLGGGVVAGLGWYAPSLHDPAGAGLLAGQEAQWVQLLQTGVNAQGAALGPMAQVVTESTQHWQAADLQAAAEFLRSPGTDAALTPVQKTSSVASSDKLWGERLYTRQCVVCHGAQGEGVAGAFVPLAGNRAVLAADPRNVVQMILQGGYAAATSAHPQPHGMPPFGHVLNDAQVAALASYIRSAWGNNAPAVGNMEVYRVRERRGS